MKAFLDCLPCIVRQGLQTARLASSNPDHHQRVLQRLLAELSIADLSATPIELGQMAQSTVREVTGCVDPYAELRRRSNQEALQLYPRLKAIVARAEDKLLAAAKLAIAGNIIDFGALGDDFDVEATIDRVLSSPISIDDYPAFARRVEGASTVLYLADNAGEIVFDRVLIEEMPGKKLIVAVRAAPFINDAIRADAGMVGLAERAEIIEAPIGLTRSERLDAAWGAADLIVSKGQANYEAYSEADGPIFFLLLAKCDFIARDIGCEKGDIILKAR
jgi:uncharacterized protein with ATP-grasp and redox domains